MRHIPPHIETALKTLSGAMILNNIPNRKDKLKRIKEIIFEDEHKELKPINEVTLNGKKYKVLKPTNKCKHPEKYRETIATQPPHPAGVMGVTNWETFCKKCGQKIF